MIQSVQEHNKALREEMKKANPRDHLLLPLMKSTFHSRRVFRMMLQVLLKSWIVIQPLHNLQW